MKFKAEDLREMVCGADVPLTLIEDKITGTSRWNTEHEVVFEFEDRFYATGYRGAVGDGESDMWEYGDEVECPEVFKVEKTITVYE